MIRIPPRVRQLSTHFFRNNFQCFLVGGAIRDMLMGRVSTDFDIATDARPQDVQRLFRRVIPTGIKHGTVTVLYKDSQFEVTTFRIESDYQDGRRPESVTFTPSILEDLKRRDFTINALAYDLSSNVLLDPHAGQKDLKAGIIRAIGDPLERFREDGLRPVRACRFAAQFNFQIEETTFKSISRVHKTVARVSQERIRDELIRLLQAEKPSIGFTALGNSGLLKLIIPELTEGIGVIQRERHCFDVYEHSLITCDAAPRDNLTVRLAAVLHDIGKPRSRREDNGKLTFHQHDQLSAEMAESITRRLKFPNRIIDRVTHLIRQHMFNYQEEWSDAAIRRFISRVGTENMSDLLALRRADQIGQCGEWTISHGLIALEDRIREAVEQAQAVSLKDLKVSGREIMEALSIDPGPRIGVILEALLDSVLDDPELNERKRLIEIAEKFYRRYLKSR